MTFPDKHGHHACDSLQSLEIMGGGVVRNLIVHDEIILKQENLPSQNMQRERERFCFPIYNLSKKKHKYINLC
jgi:hypothetical protein